MTRGWAQRNLAGNALTGVLNALDHIPGHRHPQIKLDSQSPWIHVDQLPGPNMAVWIPTGNVYEVLSDGSVAMEPLPPKEVNEDSQVPQEGDPD